MHSVINLHQKSFNSPSSLELVEDAFNSLLASDVYCVKAIYQRLGLTNVR